MAKIFEITADNRPVVLKDGFADISFTVTNRTDNPSRGLAKIQPRGATKTEWLAVRGEAERNFPPKGSDSVVVRITSPPGTPPGNYPFRLYIWDPKNPNDFSEGPEVFFELKGEPIPPAPKRSWIYIVLGVAAILLIAGILFALLRSKSSGEAAFVANVERGFAPLTVNFTNLTGGKFRGVIWSFGDGETDTNANPAHTFRSHGTYNVTLVSPGKKGQSVATRSIAVLEKANAQFVASPNSGPVPLKVVFINQSIGDDLRWNWTFGNGNVSTNREPDQIYQNPGTFTVTLTATGPDGNTSTHSAQIQAQAPSKANFSANKTSGESPLTVSFTDKSVGNPTSWDWDFGDGMPHSHEQNPSHTFQRAPNSYTVTLRITGAGGGDTAIRTGFIHVSVPTTTVPLVSGMAEGRAVQLLNQNGLKLGAISFIPFPAPIVISQTPAANARVSRGSSVNLVVGRK